MSDNGVRLPKARTFKMGKGAAFDHGKVRDLTGGEYFDVQKYREQGAQAWVTECAARCIVEIDDTPVGYDDVKAMMADWHGTTWALISELVMQVTGTRISLQHDFFAQGQPGTT